MVGGAELKSVGVVIAIYEVFFAECSGKDLRQEINRNGGINAEFEHQNFRVQSMGPT
jgi:hypothetical protein